MPDPAGVSALDPTDAKIGVRVSHTVLVNSHEVAERLLTADPRDAARALAGGGLVAMPTETVYGLAADAENPAAVGRVFRVKGRPSDHPLIVHVADVGALSNDVGWALDAPDYAYALAKAFWPGPLTLILPRGHRAGDHVTGALASVGLRAPGHRVAQQLLDRFAEFSGRRYPGVAAPSANRFGRVSPTSSADVVAELGDLLDPARDVVLDDGRCEVGVESTIVDCTGALPALLRPGAIGVREIATTTGLTVGAASGTVRAPGMLTSHYAPTARVILAEDIEDLQSIVRSFPGRCGVLAESSVPTPSGAFRLAAPASVHEYARALYAALRSADVAECQLVVALPPTAGAAPAGLTVAITDRLRRAAAAHF